MNSVAKALSLSSDSKELNNFASLNHFIILEGRKIDDKEKQHNKHEDLISHSADKPPIVIVTSPK